MSKCPRPYLTELAPMETCDGTTVLVCQEPMVYDNGIERTATICGRYNNSHDRYDGERWLSPPTGHSRL